MKVGSIVECVKPSGWPEAFPMLNVKIPKVGRVYTVRGIYEKDGYQTGLYLEEIVNDPLPFVNVEPSFKIDEFRELELDSISLEALLEEKIEEKY